MNNKGQNNRIKAGLSLAVVLFFFSFRIHGSLAVPQNDTIPLYDKGKIRKSIYPQTAPQHRLFYNFLWGKHYRDLYSTPITVKSAKLNSLYGGLRVQSSIPLLNGLLMQDNKKHLYLLRPVDGSSVFSKSDLLKRIYSKKDFKETYLDEFLTDVYTTAFPYAFVLTDELAGKVNLNSFDPQIFYIPDQELTDTVPDGSGIQDRLVSIYNLSVFTSGKNVINTDSLFAVLHSDKQYQVNQSEYIRERLLNMLFGDWNKSEENWRWLEKSSDGKLVYTPIVLDRNAAFSKVDGILFKGVLNMLGLKSVSDYNSKIDNFKKLNAIAYPLDVALTSQSDEEAWVREARFIVSQLTDNTIDSVFTMVPDELHGRDLDRIKMNLKKRRMELESVARNYCKYLQKTPVLTASDKDDRIVVERTGKKDLNISIYDAESGSLSFRKTYNKLTDEIWIYGLDGNDRFELTGLPVKGTPLIFVGGKGNNNYKIDNSQKLKIYEYPSYKQDDDTLSGTKMIRTNVENVHQYDSRKLKYSSLSITPFGVYDTDLGLYLGAFATYTKYGFKRSPYSYRHSVGYNYLVGFMYQGFFPNYNDSRTIILEAFASAGTSFTNFFGYGNETNPFRNEKQNFNRIYFSKYSISPSYRIKMNWGQEVISKAGLELFRVHRQENKFLTKIYTGPIEDFKTKVFTDLSITYGVSKELSRFIPSVSFSVTPGWKINVGNPGNNFQYIKSDVGINLAFIDRLTLATKLGCTVLFTDKYEFYQAAQTDLRGFRNSRFIGKQSFYQQTDLRLDMGRLENPFTPVDYGVFAGFDHGRVWYPGEHSNKWHHSWGGGFWLTFFKSYTGKFSYFKSDEGHRLWFGLGMGF